MGTLRLMGNFPFISFVPFILSSLFSLFSLFFLFPPFVPSTPPHKKTNDGRASLCLRPSFCSFIYVSNFLKIYAHNLVDAVDARDAVDSLLKFVERVHREVDSAYCNAVDIFCCKC